MTYEGAADFDGFYSATCSRLLHVLYAMTGDLAEAQDVVQEAYARAWQRWSTVSEYDDPAAWVRTVAWRLAISRRHKARNRISAAIRLHATQPAITAPSADTTSIVAALRQLPVRQCAAGRRQGGPAPGFEGNRLQARGAHVYPEVDVCSHVITLSTEIFGRIAVFPLVI